MPRWTDDELLRIITHKERSHQSYADVAETLLGDRDLAEPLRKAVMAYKRRKTPVIPNPEPRLFKGISTIPYADTLVIADTHAPYQNADLLRKAFKLALSAGTEEIVIAGDLHDFNSLSSMSKGEPTTPFEVDIQHAREILYAAAYQFKMIRIVSGNHDEYYTKKKGVTFQELIYDVVLEGKYTLQVDASNYDYLYMGDEYLIGHLSNYDDEPGALAQMLADKYNRHVLVGHDHLRGYKRAKNGKLGISIGAMLTPDRFWYKQRRLNTFNWFQLGFALIINKEIYHFSEEGNTELNGKCRDFDYWSSYFHANEHLK